MKTLLLAAAFATMTALPAVAEVAATTTDTAAPERHRGEMRDGQRPPREGREGGFRREGGEMREGFKADREKLHEENKGELKDLHKDFRDRMKDAKDDASRDAVKEDFRAKEDALRKQNFEERSKLTDEHRAEMDAREKEFRAKRDEIRAKRDAAEAATTK